jgi:pyruvate/2-oxoglutarate dehydrogenase complex dihydrolipoamide dehydrogenase (E3) component
MPDFDAIIIGTGQAGPSLAFRLAGAGMKEARRAPSRRRHCLQYRLHPTKALVASAYDAQIRAARHLV